MVHGFFCNLQVTDFPSTTGTEGAEQKKMNLQGEAVELKEKVFAPAENISIDLSLKAALFDRPVAGRAEATFFSKGLSCSFARNSDGPSMAYGPTSRGAYTPSFTWSRAPTFYYRPSPAEPPPLPLLLEPEWPENPCQPPHHETSPWRQQLGFSLVRAWCEHHQVPSLCFLTGARYLCHSPMQQGKIPAVESRKFIHGETYRRAGFF